jgi:hypothetical protein
VKLVGYVRVSTSQQALGESLEAQEQAIREWAERAGAEVVAILEDGGRSGRTSGLGCSLPCRCWRLARLRRWSSTDSTDWPAPSTYRRQS